MPERPDHDSTGDPLDRDRAAAFGPARASGDVLDTLAGSIGSVPRVLLPDTETGDEGPLVKPGSPEVPDAPGRYQLFGEIARGGMGAVLKGRDTDLGRDLALKVLLAQHRDNPDFVRRFVEEAQIGGQLQHPGIVPVYELGTFSDGRPYFAMKLVKGRTLAALLDERKDPRDDLPRFLGIFEQVARTVAYAHARGVIHRDLKPTNVMVGSFGEVQVMDWGLAKALKQGGVADEERSQSPPVEVSVIRTVRSGSSLDESQAGSVLGTPAYMAPEQAGGDIEMIDRRADVFGLGSILCEILTGQPAYTGRNGNEVLRKAMRGDTADACARLATCEADPELVTLARDCLAAEPADRPREAGAVSGRITAYLAGVQEKLRTAERERAVAEARTVEERRGRKLQVGLAAAVLALTTVGGLSTTYYLQQKQAHAAAVARILGEATTLRDQARADPDDPARWHAALAAIRRVEEALGTGTGGDVKVRQQSDALRAEVRAGSDRAERAHRLLERLIDIRSAKADDPDGSATDAAYADAFQQAGIDLAALPSAEVGAAIKAHAPATRLALAATLDDWAAVRRSRRGDKAGAKQLSDAARSADPDPWRRDLRDALDQTDKSARLTALQATARSAQWDALGAVSLDLLGTALDHSGDPAAAETVLRAAQRRHPGDVWVNHDLGVVLQHLGRRDEAIRYFIAARSIRPETAHELADVLPTLGESDEAIAVFHDLIRLRPKNGGHLGCLGILLQSLGRNEEAEPWLDAAIAAGREAIRLKPHDATAHATLGVALKARGKLEDGLAALRRAGELASPDSPLARDLPDQIRRLEERIAVPASGSGEDTVKLQFVASGARRKQGAYSPRPLALKAERPAGLAKAPELADPLFGVLTLGAQESPVRVIVAVDEPNGRPARLHVDSNANGDLTDDPAPEWQSRTRKEKDGKDVTSYSGGASIELPLGGTRVPVRLDISRLDKNDPRLHYSADYGYEGVIALGTARYYVMLVDRLTTGDFRGAADMASSGAELKVDVNQNGRFDNTGESFDVRRPFAIKGTTYEVAGMSASGSEFQIRKRVPALALGKPIVRLQFFSSGAQTKTRFYRPHLIQLRDEKPQALKTAPELVAPRFGVLSLGARESPTRVIVVLDEPQGRPSRLYVDSNANGDLTDDPAPEWPPSDSWSGGAFIRLPLGGATVTAHLGIYSVAGNLNYYADYGYDGEITLSDVTYNAMLIDNSGTADFRGTGKQVSDTVLLIDLNQNGQFEIRGEQFDVRKPVTIKGTTYEITGLDASGAGFEIRKSDKSIAEVVPAAERVAAPPDLGVGRTALNFTARTTDGQEVKFPSTYAGKLVVLDFWATWCGPCIAELPHLTRAYEKFHDQGLEILGISLDQPDAGEKVALFTQEKKMPWRQIYDGKFWKAEVAVLYGVHSIPRAYLVDGDTGQILATDASLRGERLEKTLADALGKKGLLKKAPE
jgi:serine/threonine-protein kinase